MADESKFDQAKGNIKETVGNISGNKELELSLIHISEPTRPY